MVIKLSNGHSTTEMADFARHDAMFADNPRKLWHGQRKDCLDSHDGEARFFCDVNVVHTYPPVN